MLKGNLGNVLKCYLETEEFLEDEEKREKELINLMNEERLKYIAVRCFQGLNGRR